MQSAFTLILFLLLVLGGGTLIGLAARPGEWYARLAKPAFNPPDWVFAPVWMLLYVLIALAGWRTWQAAPLGAGMALWCAQLALNFSWSPVFFRAHRMGAALVIVLAMLAATLGFVALSWTADRLAALLFVPYAAWAAFAALLNAAIWRLNRAGSAS
jgi:translocator protein